METASQSVRSGDILSGYLFLLSNSTSTVGYIQGINGVLQASCCHPSITCERGKANIFTKVSSRSSVTCSLPQASLPCNATSISILAAVRLLLNGLSLVVQLLSALPAGWLADRFRCDRTLVLAAGFGTLGGICLAVALLLQLPIAAYFLAMAAIGLYRGCYSPPLETIFADSVRTGNRSGPSCSRTPLTAM